MTTRRQRGKGEGSIYQRADGKWCAALHTVDGKRKVLYGKTRQHVARKLTAALQAREEGALVVGPCQTVAQFFNRWLDDVVQPNLRPRRYKVYEGKTRLHILPELGKLSLAALTPQHLQRLYSKKIAEGVAPKSVNNLHVVIHRALSYAVRWGLVARNVADAAEPPRVSRREVQPFSAQTLTSDSENMLSMDAWYHMRYHDAAARHHSQERLKVLWQTLTSAWPAFGTIGVMCGSRSYGQ